MAGFELKIVGKSAPLKNWTKPRLLGEILSCNCALDPGDLAKALALQSREDARLGEILLAQGMVGENDLMTALAEKFSAKTVDLAATPPAPRLFNELPAEMCLKFSFLPWRRVAGMIIIVTSEPEDFSKICDVLPEHLGAVVMALAPASDIYHAISLIQRDYLSGRADLRCPENFSCRTWAKPVGRSKLWLMALIAVLICWAMPVVVAWVAVIWVFINLAATSTMRLVALWVQAKERYRKAHPVPAASTNVTHIAKLPKVSVLVPLHKEEKILPKLIERLSKSDYPRELYDVVLVIESNDKITRAAVATLELPRWMRVIEVPASGLQTKPRAMNYALDFCKGSIIGIYDAEDAPEADQIHRIAAHFRQADPSMACVQGYLDFYNPRQNWLARCFTIEYSVWFRVMLHGIQKLGMPVPLGGTTAFFRRKALEELGAWDAHNVTEDANLGMRLERLGYHCEFVATTAFEEANCRARPWVKQRSRWLKGYAMTWITHMRHPKSLLKDLGFAKFAAFQILLLGTLSTFALAPIIWSLWWISFGGTLPYSDLLPMGVWSALGMAFIGSEILLIILGLFATWEEHHRHLMLWVPGMILYWPLGTLAVYKALYELLIAPFYWDKTQHGG